MLTNDWQAAPCTQGGCVEARLNDHGAVLVRSTTTGERLTVLATEWRAFLAGARAGQFDLPGGLPGGAE